MKRRIFCACLCAVLGAAEKLPEPIAWIGKMPLESARFAHLKVPADPALRRKVLTQAVNTEAYVIIINRLLTMSRIAPESQTAERYISFRKIQAGPNWSAEFEKKLKALVNNPDFQLKSALFFTLYAAAPASVEPAAAEIEQFFYQNRANFKIPEQRSYSVFTAGTTAKVAEAESLLHQGMAFAEVAAKFDPEGSKKRIPGDLLLQINQMGAEMKPGEWRKVRYKDNICLFQLKAVVPEKMLSFEAVAPLIREELSGVKLKNALELYIQAELRKHPLKLNF